jgi:hypothetical protein
MEWKEFEELFKEVKSYGAEFSVEGDMLYIKNGEDTLLSIDNSGALFKVSYNGEIREYTENELLSEADVLKSLILTKLDGVDRGLSDYHF